MSLLLCVLAFASRIFISSRFIRIYENAVERCAIALKAWPSVSPNIMVCDTMKPKGQTTGFFFGGTGTIDDVRRRTLILDGLIPLETYLGFRPLSLLRALI